MEATFLLVLDILTLPNYILGYVFFTGIAWYGEEAKKIRDSYFGEDTETKYMERNLKLIWARFKFPFVSAKIFITDLVILILICILLWRSSTLYIVESSHILLFFSWLRMLNIEEVWSNT